MRKHLLAFSSIGKAAIIMILLVSIAVRYEVPLVNAQTPCIQPPPKKDQAGNILTQFAWPQNANVNVTINADQFNTTERDCLTAAFTNWNNQNQNNQSNVTFNVTYSSSPAVTTDSSGHITSATSGNVYQVNKSTVGLSPTALGVTGGQPASNSRQNAFSDISPNVTNCTALTEVMAHEIGHTFGLDDCTSCTGTGQSVMAVGKCATFDSNGHCIAANYNDTTMGTTGPTSCDNQGVISTGQYPKSSGGGGGDTGGGGGTYCTNGTDSEVDFDGVCYTQYNRDWQDCGNGPVYQDDWYETGTTCFDEIE